MHAGSCANGNGCVGAALLPCRLQILKHLQIETTRTDQMQYAIAISWESAYAKILLFVNSEVFFRRLFEDCNAAIDR